MSFVSWFIFAFGGTLALAAVGLIARSTRRRGLVLAALFEALALVGTFLLLASSYSMQWFGRLVIPIDLPQLLAGTLPAIAGLLLGCALALFLIFPARSRLEQSNSAAMVALLVAPVLLGAIAGWTLTDKSFTFATTGNSVAPTQPTAQAEATRAVKGPNVQPGFRVSVFYAEAVTPTSITFGPDGALYIAELSTGKIKAVRDTNQDGVGEQVVEFAAGPVNPKGIAFRPGTNELYVSVPGRIVMMTDTDGDGVMDRRSPIRANLAVYDIEHSNNGIAFGPDGRLYIAQGGERVRNLQWSNGQYFEKGGGATLLRMNPLAGGILVADADGKNLTRFARGMRNPYDLAFAPDGKLFATDNGADSIPNPAGDELNYVVQDGDYGYPYTFGFPAPWEKSRAPVVNYRAHSSPDGLVVYDGQMFPSAFRGNIFVAVWADETRVYSKADYDRGYSTFYRVRKIDRVQLEETPDGLKGITEDFAWNFVHPLDVTVGPDGALYVADFSGTYAGGGGTIYRITYVGP